MPGVNIVPLNAYRRVFSSPRVALLVSCEKLLLQVAVFEFQL